MKRIIILLVFIHYGVLIKAQQVESNLSILTQKSFIGNCLRLEFGMHICDNNTIKVGLRYRSFDPKNEPIGNDHLFRDKFAPTKFLQNFGLTFSDEYSLGPATLKVNPFIFYDLQIVYMGIYNSFLDLYGYSEEGYPIYILNYIQTEPMVVLENNFGFGGKATLSHNLDFIFKMGLGISLINLTDKNYRVPAKAYTYFSYLGSFGLSYSF